MRLLSAPVESKAGLSTTVAWLMADQPWYALEGNITVTGGAVDWLAQLFDLAGGARRLRPSPVTLHDTDGVYLVPAFAGSGAPHWDENARGLICGLTRGTTAAHVALATVHSIAYQVRDVFEAMRRDAATPIPELLADGGASGNDALMQFQADILGVPVIRNRSTDISAFGAAYLAGLALGLWSSTRQLGTVCLEPRSGSSHEVSGYGASGSTWAGPMQSLESGTRVAAHVRAEGSGEWDASMSCGLWPMSPACTTTMVSVRRRSPNGSTFAGVGVAPAQARRVGGDRAHHRRRTDGRVPELEDA